MIKHILLLVLLLVLCGVGLTSTNASAITYAVERPTSSGETLPAGTVIVADGNAVRPAHSDEGQYVFGVVAALPKGSVSPGTVGVASSGIVSVLVSDIGGTIKSGDRIALSSIDGVGMKSQTSGWMIGTAQADFATSSYRAVQEQVTANDGKKMTVSIKQIPVLLSVTYYNPDSSGTAGSGIMGSLQNTLGSAVGHSVPTDRVLLALLIFGVAIILLVTLVYSAVKHSLISIGRNPLAHTKITASLVKVLLTAVAVIIITLGIIYLILK